MVQYLKQVFNLNENIIFLFYLNVAPVSICDSLYEDWKVWGENLKLEWYREFRWPVCRLENNIRAIIYRISCLCVRHKGMGGRCWGLAPHSHFLGTRWKSSGQFHSHYLGKGRTRCWVGLTAGVDIQEEKSLSLSGIEPQVFWRIARSLVAVPAC